MFPQPLAKATIWSLLIAAAAAATTTTTTNAIGAKTRGDPLATWRHLFDSLFVASLSRPYLDAFTGPSGQLFDELARIAYEPKLKTQLDQDELQTFYNWFIDFNWDAPFRCKRASEQKIAAKRQAILEHPRRLRYYELARWPSDVKLDEFIEETRRHFFRWCQTEVGRKLEGEISNLPREPFNWLTQFLLYLPRDDLETALVREVSEHLRSIGVNGHINYKHFAYLYRSLFWACPKIVRLVDRSDELSEYADYVEAYWMNESRRLVREWLGARRLCRDWLLEERLMRRVYEAVIASGGGVAS